MTLGNSRCFHNRPRESSLFRGALRLNLVTKNYREDSEKHSGRDLRLISQGIEKIKEG